VEIPSQAVYGTLGMPEPKNVVTGPCYLTHEEIKSLGRSTAVADVRKMARMHPTFEDIVCSPVSYHVDGHINNWQETHHYATLVSQKTGLSYEELVHVFTEEASLIFDGQKKMAALYGYQNDAEMIWTHEKHVQEMLKGIAIRYANQYLSFVKDRNGKLSEALSKTPSECSKLQIVSTYCSEANKNGCVTAIESFQNLDNIWPAYRMFGTNAILLKEPKDSKAISPRMNSSSQNSVIYLGPEADFSEEIKKLTHGTKKPAGCGVFGLLYNIFSEENITELHELCEQTDKEIKKHAECPKCVNHLIYFLEYMKVDK
ncbi:MAG: hypothetical protein QMD85_01710, partial [Candidatus Aenigmarchaeota archaeon]|nr:hypothetical protein [Candidatus Aenigmarchaeota archaeon]MDI6722269.1 hypothetical protein [Candidatus Aenigmarchaeota archaeon]